nr:MAG TPA: hypothetical protein [Caudoviricetes sp.]
MKFNGHSEIRSSGDGSVALPYTLQSQSLKNFFKNFGPKFIRHLL